MVAKAVESLSEAGFVNYFGMQRFGISSIPTHHIGRYIRILFEAHFCEFSKGVCLVPIGKVL